MNRAGHHRRYGEQSVNNNPQAAECVSKLYLQRRYKNYKDNPDIKWNFTKFVVDRSGKVVARFETTTDRKELENCVEALIEIK